MGSKYGDEQKMAAKAITEELILQLKLLYLKQFEKIGEENLAPGTIVKLTQLFLISRDAAITPLRKEYE